MPLSSGGRKPPRSHGLSPQGAIAGTARAQRAGLRSVRCQGPPIRPLGWSKPAKSGLGALPRTPRLHERRQLGALSWVQSGVLWAPIPRQTGGAWPQGTPRAGGLRWGPGGAALRLTSADIDPRAPISSPMGGARGLLTNPKVRWMQMAPGGSMDLWARPYVERRALVGPCSPGAIVSPPRRP